MPPEGLRTRAGAVKAAALSERRPSIPKPIDLKAIRRPPLTVLDILRPLAGLLLLSTLLSYFVTRTPWWGPRPLFTRPAFVLSRLGGPRRLTLDQLAGYNGTDASKPIYLALTSVIYDVSASPHFYGPGGSYHNLAGVDASRAFVTGCFETDRTPDTRGLEWMYVPRSFDVAPWELDATWGTEWSPEERKRERGEWKTAREQALRHGRAEVQRVLDGWRALFSGRKQGWRSRYWRVGQVVDTETEWQGPVRELCAQAQRKRPETPEQAPTEA